MIIVVYVKKGVIKAFLYIRGIQVLYYCLVSCSSTLISTLMLYYATASIYINNEK